MREKPGEHQKSTNKNEDENEESLKLLWRRKETRVNAFLFTDASHKVSNKPKK
jgi:hypothetical protein